MNRMMVNKLVGNDPVLLVEIIIDSWVKFFHVIFEMCILEYLRKRTICKFENSFYKNPNKTP